MSFLSLSERENWKFSADLSEPRVSEHIRYDNESLRLVKLMMKVVMHVPQEMRPQTGLGGGCSQGRLCHSHRACLSRQQQHPAACKEANLLRQVSMQELQGQTQLQHKISQIFTIQHHKNTVNTCNHSTFSTLKTLSSFTKQHDNNIVLSPAL